MNQASTSHKKSIITLFKISASIIVGLIGVNLLHPIFRPLDIFLLDTFGYQHFSMGLIDPVIAILLLTAIVSFFASKNKKLDLKKVLLGSMTATIINISAMVIGIATINSKAIIIPLVINSIAIYFIPMKLLYKIILNTAYILLLFPIWFMYAHNIGCNMYGSCL